MAVISGTPHMQVVPRALYRSGTDLIPSHVEKDTIRMSIGNRKLGNENLNATFDFDAHQN